ncbi:MAG: hypothetical protein WA949_00225 [Phormidesmis sp.]
MVRPQPRPMTLEAFLALPDTKPASDFINGQIIQKPVPQGKHSRLQDKLVNVINEIQCCLQPGTGMGWLIDPNDRAVLIHRPKKEVQIVLIDEPGTILSMPDFMGELSYPIEDLFNLLKA